MVDVIDRRLGVDELDEILDDLDDVCVGEHAHVRIGREAQLLVEPVASDTAEVVSLFGEEELVDDIPCRALIRRFRIAELLVDIVDGLYLRIRRVLLQGVEYDGIFVGVRLVLLEKDGLLVRLQNGAYGIIVQHFASLDDDFDALHRRDVSGVFIDEVLEFGLEYVVGELAALVGFKFSLAYRDFVRKVEDVNDVLVRIEAYRPEKRRDRQLLLAVDVGVHHVVDVGGELYPGTLERNDAGGIELRAVGVHALVEEHARRPVQLGHDNALGTVDDERAGRSHIRDVPQIYVLNPGVEILVFGIRAGKAKLGLERDIVGQSSVKTLFDRVLRRIDEIVDKLKLIAVPRVLYRENLLENLIQAFILPVLRGSLKLEEVLERLQLHLKKIRILQNFGCSKVYALVIGLF